MYAKGLVINDNLALVQHFYIYVAGCRICSMQPLQLLP